MTLMVGGDGDLVFANGELQMVDGEAETDQSVRLLLGTAKHEFLLDDSEGMDMTPFQKKVPDNNECTMAIVECLSQLDNFGQVTSVTYDFDAERRKLSISAEIEMKDGSTESYEGVTSI